MPLREAVGEVPAAGQAWAAARSLRHDTAPQPPGSPPENRDRRAWEARYVRALLLVDVAVAGCAAVAAFGLRFGPDVTLYNQWYVLVSAILPLLWVLCLAVNRGYETRYLFVGTDEYQRVFRAGIALLAGVAIVSYGLEIRLARGYVLLALPATVLACVLTRYAQRKHLHRTRASGGCLRRVVVVGHERAVVHLTGQLRRERFHGLQVVAACLPATPLPAPSTRHARDPAAGRVRGVDLPVYGGFDDVATAVRRANADTVVVLSCPELDGVELRRLAWQLERDDVDLIVASALLDVAPDRTTIRPVDGLPMLHVEHPRLTGAARVAKEIFDRIGAALLILALSPLLLAVAALVRRDSAGPVLFRQTRIGRDGDEFTMLKFRTMYADAERRLAELIDHNDLDGALFKLRNDPRVTPVGRWLRRWSLDELPQLFNVLRGEMSLVGPRPPLPREVAAYPDDMRRRFVVKPGLTGLWQVSGRSDLRWEESVRLDLRYVENWSLTLDLVILLRTLTAVSRASGAY